MTHRALGLGRRCSYHIRRAAVPSRAHSVTVSVGLSLVYFSLGPQSTMHSVTQPSPSLLNPALARSPPPAPESPATSGRAPAIRIRLSIRHDRKPPATAGTHDMPQPVLVRLADIARVRQRTRGNQDPDGQALRPHARLHDLSMSHAQISTRALARLPRRNDAHLLREGLVPVPRVRKCPASHHQRATRTDHA